MMDSLLKRIERNRKAHIRWLAMVLCLSMIVSLGTFAGFRQTAVAKTYTKEVLDCPFTHEGAEPVAHVHNDDCYDGKTLVCTLPEREAHIHTDECFAEQQRLTCGLEENPGHQHGDACFAAREQMVCGLEENPGHVHNGTCFNDSGVLICGMEAGEGAHAHTADCFTTVYDLVCQIPEGEGAHTHTEECYTTERVQVCGKAELPVHVHDAGCFHTEEIDVDEPDVKTVPEMPVSDPNADLETSDDWNREFENFELSGNWARDLVLVAATQQGRGESQYNFEAVLNDAGDAWVRHGYTRYGAWYGVPYAEEWSAMFVSFCLRYAGIPEENVPNNPTAAFMAESFSMGELFAGRDYVPAVGDLIFFGTVNDEITTIDHMGIVYHVDAENGTINTVEGDRTDVVATFGYTLDDEQIVGYGILPQNPNYVPTEEENNDDETDGLIVMTMDEDKEETTDTTEAIVPAVPMPAQSWERTAGGIKVTVDAPEGAFPENTTIAVTPVNGNSLKDTVSDAVSGEVLEVQAVDITFFDADGHEIEPAIPIRVVMTPAATQHAEEKTSVVHVDVAQQTAELIEQTAGTELDNSEVVFDADAFTIYAIVYTYQVEYEYEVDGKTFTSSMPGAENMSLTQIVEGLGIVDEAEIGTFVSKITSIASSDEEVAVVNENNEIRVLKDGEAKIVITMQDGAKFHIDVRAEGETSTSNETATVSTKGDLYLPADAELKTEVLDEVKSESAIAAVEAQEGTANRTAAAAETAYQVFDISLENVEADQYNGFQVEVKLPENVVGKNFHLYHVHDGKVDELKLDNTAPDGETMLLESVSFVTPSFSEFVLSYTVDFEYEVDGKIYSYSIPGETSITLDALLRELNIVNNENVNGFLNKIESVVFSNPDLVKVTEVLRETPIYAIEDNIFDLDVYTGSSRTVNQTVVAGRNWILTSVAPFTSEESLTIRLIDGQQTIIKVTDSQASGDLAAFVTDATLEIDGKTYGAGTTWNVRPDVDYKLTLNFLEKGSRQLPGGGQEITMDMPSGLSLEPGVSGSFDIPCGLAGTLIGNTWWVDGTGKLHIQFAEDPDDLLTRSSNIHFDLTLDAKFDGSEKHFEFNNNVKRDAEFNYDTDVDVQKSGSYNASTGKMEYTVTVKSTGKSENVTVSDVISGNMLTLDENSFEITPSSKTPSSTSTNSKGFTMTFGEMVHNETVTIKYTASVDTSKIGPGGTVSGENGKNSVTVTNKDEKTDTDENITNTIKFSDIAKSSTSSTETTDGEKVEMEWKITANEGQLGSIKGSKITDTIDHGSKDIMHYVVGNDGKLALTVKKIAPNGTTTTETVYVDVSKTYDQGPETWTWIPQDEGNYAYEITYKTLVTKQTENTTVKNNASNESDGSTSGTGVVPGTNPGGGGGPGTDDIVGGKAAVAVTPDYIDWDIVVAVQPDDDFTEKFEIVDEIPNGADLGRNFADTFDSILSVTGLNETHEDWTYAVTKEDHNNLTSKQKDILTITFWQDKEHNDPGIDKGARTITVRIRTRNDPDWVNFADTAGGGEQAIYHTNKAKVNNSNWFTDRAAPLHTKIDKEKEKDLSSVTVDGVQLPQYEYSVTLTNISELPVVITDTYDPDELVFVCEGQPGWDGHNGIAANEQKNMLNIPDSNYHATFTADDTTGTLTITANSLPTKPDGSYYEFYRIYYTMRVKNADALDSFAQQAIANGGTYLIGNTAEWNGDDDHVDVEYKVPGLSKEGYFSSSSNNRQYTFILDVNRNGLTMNDGETMDLLDSHTKNLSVDYSTVKVYKITDGQSFDDATKYQLNESMLTNEVTWNFDANEGTFSIPDRTHYVITYDALVIGSGNQEFKNEAELKGYKSSKEDKRDYGSDSHAGGSIPEINLLKYEAGQTSKGLQGAVFQLLKGTGEYDPVTGDEIKEELKYGKSGTRPDGTTFEAGENITFTTGSDGTVKIALNQTHHGEQLDTEVHYFLKEIDSPPGYQIDSSVEYWEFTLTDDPDEVNYGDPDRRDERGRRQWIYFSYGDILKMANKSTVEPLSVVVNKQWFDEDGNEITEENLNPNFKATVQLLRKTDNGDYVKVKVTGSGSNLTVTEVSDNSGEIELNSDNNWAYTWSQLPRVAYGGQGGMEIIAHYAYKVEEVSVEGYVSSVSETENETTKTYALKNYKVPEDRNTKITVNKVWQDAEGNEIPGTTEKLPDSVRFKIYRVTSKTPFTRVPSSGGNIYIINGDSHLLNGDDDTNDNYGIYQISKSESWTATFSNLPSVVTVDNETTYYAYYVKEEKLPGYTITYTSDGTTRTIVNREPLDEDSNYIDIGLEKKWTDGTKTTPPAGATATFTVHQQKSELSGGNIVVKLINKDSGELITTTKCGEDGKISISFSSDTSYHYIWFAAKQADGNWNGNAFSAQTGELSDGSSSYSGEVTLNSFIVDGGITIGVSDSEYQKLSNISLTGATFVQGDWLPTDFTRTVTLPTSAGAWLTTVRNLIQEDADGNLYRYYITEDSCSPNATTVSFKDKDGNDIKDTNAAEGVNQTTASLNNPGQKVEVTNTYENQFGSLKLTKVVTVNDNPPSGNAQNALTNGTYEFTIHRVNDGDDNSNDIKVTITFADGIATKYQIGSDNEVPIQKADVTGNTWSVIVSDLAPGEYTITETPPTNGTALTAAVRGIGTGDGDAAAVDENKVVTVTVKAGEDTPADTSNAAAKFTNNINTTSATVKKIWKDADDKPLTTNLPSSLTVELIAVKEVPNTNGEGTQEEHSIAGQVVLKDENSWQGTVSDLPVKDKNGKDITYYWSEETLQGFHMVSQETEGQITTITNKKSVGFEPKTSYKGTKTWMDEEDPSLRPTELTIELYADGEKVPTNQYTVEWNKEKNPWTYEIKNLPVFKYDDPANKTGAHVIQYTVKEPKIDSYNGTLTSVPTSYKLAEPGITMYTSCSDLEHQIPDQRISMENPWDLPFVAIKHGDLYWVWTPRIANDDEKQLIITALAEKSFGVVDKSDFYSGMPMTLQAKNGTISFSMHDANHIQLSFKKANTWSYFAYGTCTSTYDPGKTDLINTLTELPFSFEKQWKNIQKEIDSWAGDITVSLSRSYKDAQNETVSEQVGTFKIAFVESDGSFTVTSDDKTVTLKKQGDTNNYKADEKELPEGWSGPIELTVAAGPVYDFKTAKLPMSKTVQSGETKETYSYTYAVSETELPQGYIVSYANKGKPVAPGAQFTDNGGTIINETFGGVELPQTGGIGTTLFTALGGLMTVTAGAILTLKSYRRRKENA